MNASSNNANRGGSAERLARQRSGMTTTMFRLWMAAFACVTMIALSACGEVESCKRGSVGCVDGPAMLDNTCKFGLVRNAAGNCVEPPKGECKCGSGQVCKKADNRCVDPCELPTPLPVTKIQPGACRANTAEGEDPFDYMTTITHACEQDCIRRQEYCGAPCDMTSCAPGGGRFGMFVAQAVAAQCSGMNVECAAQFCERIRDRSCAQYDCALGGLGSGAPNCAGIVCANSCPRFPDYINDGLCDDGDLSNGTSASCPWGNDCGDCGPRRGAAPNMTYDYGDICVDPVQCGGDLNDVTRATGWCVRFDSPGLSVLKCVPDCSVAGGKSCRDGFTCKELVFEVDDEGNTEGLEDLLGNKASACFPAMCGN